MLEFKWFAFSELSTELLYDLLQLRSQVFVVEQNCAYLDADGKDSIAKHLIGFENNKIVAYCRLFVTDSRAPLVFGRVLTTESVRKKGYGKKLIAKLFADCKKNYPGLAITCSAQAHLVRFYQAFGLIVQSEAYFEDGIPHVLMSTNSQ